MPSALLEFTGTRPENELQVVQRLAETRGRKDASGILITEHDLLEDRASDCEENPLSCELGGTVHRQALRLRKVNPKNLDTKDSQKGNY